MEWLASGLAGHRDVAFKVAFFHHPHNFQVARPAGPDGPAYVVSGPGGETDDPLTAPEDVAALRQAGIEVTSANRTTDFLLVEIEGQVARLFPLGCDPASGEAVPLALFGVADGGRLTASAASRYQPLRVGARATATAVASAAGYFTNR